MLTELKIYHLSLNTKLLNFYLSVGKVGQNSFWLHFWTVSRNAIIPPIPTERTRVQAVYSPPHSRFLSRAALAWLLVTPPFMESLLVGLAATKWYGTKQYILPLGHLIVTKKTLPLYLPLLPKKYAHIYGEYKCCSSVLSLVQISFSMVFGYGNAW